MWGLWALMGELTRLENIHEATTCVLGFGKVKFIDLS